MAMEAQDEPAKSATALPGLGVTYHFGVIVRRLYHSDDTGDPVGKCRTISQRSLPRLKFGGCLRLHRLRPLSR